MPVYSTFKQHADWNRSSITPMPTIYPFSRTGYMASYTEPTEEEKKKVEPWWVSVNLGRPPTSFPAMSKPLSTNVDEWYASLNAQLAARGW
ncbi:hypothetical protein M231_04746 [Tremella mesenterica]|uniref:Uncharacterized protein n=1 Tax=Tremella mesenterica TaxID=5217 RepID=A0A4Q1BK13_TREME|nr:hypothetical protein M231_04746 [Tremella mesenterica]